MLEVATVMTQMMRNLCQLAIFLNSKDYKLPKQDIQAFITKYSSKAKDYH